MATELATAYISIVAETSGIPASIRAAMGQAGAEADRQGRQAGQRFSTGFGATMKGMLGAAGVTAGLAGVAGAMKAAISSGMTFESSLNTMKAVSGATSQQLAAVSARARELGTDNQLAATSSVDAAQAMLELSKGGMSVEQSMTAARGTLQLAAAAQISAAEAATIQSSALQSFGKDASYAGTAADILANAANASSAEITDVAYAFQSTGTVANQFGVSMQDTAATIALMANSGIKGSDAGTLMKSALLALTDQGDQAQTQIEKLGLTVYDANGQFVGMSSLFGQLNKASKSMTAEQYQAATATLFGSDAMRLAGIAAQQGKEGFDKIAAAMGRQGAAADVAAAKMSGLPGAWERLKNTVQDAGLAFYDVAKGPLTSMANWGSSAIGKIVETATAAGPKVKAAWDQVSSAVKDSGVLDAWGDRLGDVFASLGESIVNLLPTLGTVGELMGMASAIIAAVGIETFVSALETLANVLEIGVVPIAQALNSVMSSMQPLVVAALAAWMGFRLVGPAVATLGANVTTLQAKTVALAGSAMAARTTLMAIATANGSIIRTSTLGAVQMGRFGSAIGQIGTHVPVVARMQQSYMNAATAGGNFARTQGVIRGAMTGVRAGVSSLAGALGGPLSAALIGASIAFMVVSSKNSQSTQAVEAYDTAVKNVTASQNGLYVALMKSRGAMTDDVFAAQQKTVESLQEKLDATSKSTGSFLDMFRGAGSDGSMLDALTGSIAEAGELASTGWINLLGIKYDHTSQNDRLNQMGKEAEELSKQLEDVGYTNETLTKSVYGSDGAFQALLATLKKADGSFKSDAAKNMAADWTEARRKFQEQQEAAKKVVPGITELGDAFEVMGNKSASASDKLSALKSAMDLLNPARSKSEAMAQFGETIRQATEAVQGIDKSAFKGDQLDTFTESGQKLRDTLVDLADKSAAVATNGGDMGKVSAENQKIFETLAAQTGKSVADIKALFGSLGGNVVDIVMKLQGDTEVAQKFGIVQMALKKAKEEGREPIVPKVSVAGAEESLKKIGIIVHDLKDGTVRLEVTGDAQKKLDLIVEAMSKVPPGKAVSVTAPGGKEIVSLLETMGVRVNRDNKKNVEVTSPLAPGVEALLKSIGLEVKTNNGKHIIVTQTGAEDVQAKLEKIKLNDGKTVTINIQEVRRQIASGSPGTPLRREVIERAQQGNADGSIRRYLDGGITALESFANGGTTLPDQALIQKADPSGGLVQWAEPSTKGEAFIPLADSKRARSTSILAAVAKMFGYELFPDGSMPDSLSGLAGGVTGSVVSSLIARTGIDNLGVQKFADGGFTSARTAEEFRQLAEGGFGASQPLTGAPYNWGGINWGDCCLRGDTPVWGPDGSTPISELQPGQRVWSYVDGKLEAHAVTAAWFSKTQETFRVRTWHRSVVGSANHPFLRLVQTAPATPRRGIDAIVAGRGWDPAEYDVEWARLDELSAGDLLVQPKNVHLEREVSNTLPSGRPIGLLEAWLLGVILGDGSISDTQVEICVYGDLRDRVRGVLHGMIRPPTATHGERVGIGTSESRAHGIRAHSTGFASELTDAGFRKPAHEKRIPECVWGWDADRQRAFLTGYCDADGYYPADVAHHGDRTYSSSSRALIEDVRYLHIALGDVVANVATNHSRKPITIKGKRVKNARPLHTISVRPAGETLVGSAAATRRPGVAYWIDTTEFTVAPILDIVEQGVEDTYDITVEGAHNFIAGGLVVHNSGAMSAFARFAAGLAAFGGRFSTASMAAQLAQMGAVMGRGPAGTMRFGWYNGGAGGGHTAGTLPDGTNVEMGGGNGGGAIGGNAAGADDPQFTDHAYFQVKADEGTQTPTPDGTGDGNGSSGGDDSGGSGGSDDRLSGRKSLSERLGGVADAFVAGQVKSLFEVLSVNDSPGWLAAIAEYETQLNSKSSKGDGTGDKSTLTAEEKAQLKAAYDQQKLEHKQAYDTEAQRLEDQYTAGQISKADYEQKKLDAKRAMEDADLKSKQEYDSKLGKTTKTDGGLKATYEQRKLDRKQAYDAEVARIKAEYEGRKLTDAEEAEQKRRLAALKIKHENEDLKAKQDYERAQLAGKTADTPTPSTPAKKVRDPGTDKPGKGEDLALPKLFDRGGAAHGVGLMPKGIIEPERILSPRQTTAFEEMVRRDFQSGIGTDQIAAKLDVIAELLRATPRGQVNYNLPADRTTQRAAKIADSRHRAGLPA